MHRRLHYTAEDRAHYREICRACPYRVTWFRGTWWCGSSWIVSPEKVVAAGARLLQRVVDGLGVQMEIPEWRPTRTCGCAIELMLRFRKRCPKGKWP